MALSYELFSGDGANRNFAVNFDYLDRDHVHVSVDGVDVAFTFLSASMVQTAVAPPAGTNNVRVYRESARDGILVEWNIAYIPKEDLDNGYLHPLYVAQEAFDRADETIGLSGDGAWDAQGHRLKSVAAGNDPQDAVNKAQLDAVVAAAGNVPVPANPADDGKALVASGGSWLWLIVLRALASLGIGEGLEDDGASGLRVKLDGGTLARTVSGLKVQSIGAAQLTMGDGLENDGSGNVRVKLDGPSLARDVSGLKIATAGVGIDKITRFDGRTRNLTTKIITNVSTELIAFNLGTVQTGDRVLFFAAAKILKGGTAGATYLYLNQDSGTAVIDEEFTNPADTMDQVYAVANQGYVLRIVTCLRITTGGTLIMSLSGDSEGSDSTCLDGAASLYALVLPGA